MKYKFVLFLTLNNISSPTQQTTPIEAVSTAKRIKCRRIESVRWKPVFPLQRWKNNRPAIRESVTTAKAFQTSVTGFNLPKVEGLSYAHKLLVIYTISRQLDHHFAQWIASALPTMQTAPSVKDRTEIKVNQNQPPCERTLIR